MVVEPIAATDDLQSAAGVLCECVEHVIEKFDVGVDLDWAAIEREMQIDLRLFRGSLDGRATSAQLRAPFA
jgi:hypothetical protein